MTAFEQDPQSEQALWRWVADYAQEYRQSLAARPVAARADSQAIASKLEALGGLPAEGCSALACVQELVALAEPGIAAMSGPRFSGWVVGGTLPTEQRCAVQPVESGYVAAMYGTSTSQLPAPSKRAS